MLRNGWFWIAIALIAAGIALTAALGALHWLLITFAASGMVLAITLLIAAYATGRAPPPQIPPLHQTAPSARIAVIYDCDVTMGYPFRDVGDGLALLYLLGEPRIDLVCVTTTYGNGPVEITTRAARRLLDRVGHSDLAVLPGAPGPDCEAESNAAARHLADTVSSRPGEIVLIATGSMTNLKHAAALEPGFFDSLRGLYLTGGVTGPLVWNKRRLAELNFALDPEAAEQVVHAGCSLTIAPGQAGLSAVFHSRHYAMLQALDDPVSHLIARKIRSWFALMRLYFQAGGFAMWDSIPAMMLTSPGLFHYERGHITSTRDELRSGRLVIDADKHAPARIVHSVLDPDGFIQAHLAAWHHLGQRLES